MYLRPVHTDLELSTLHEFIRSNPLGILTTAISSTNYPLIQSSHIPWVLDVPSETTSDGELQNGKLKGHIARANPQCKALIEAILEGKEDRQEFDSKNGTIEQEVMVLFNGPVHHYVTPKFYTVTKPVTGKVVPTWNYSAVQAYGTATIYFDTTHPSTTTFLTSQLTTLTHLSETFICQHTGSQNSRPEPWTLSDAPESYTNMLMKAIIGIEIEITSLAGKFKMSQELSEGDRRGTVEGFEALGTVRGDEMAETIREREEVMGRCKEGKEKEKEAKETKEEGKQEKPETSTKKSGLWGLISRK